MALNDKASKVLVQASGLGVASPCCARLALTAYGYNA